MSPSSSTTSKKNSSSSTADTKNSSSSTKNTTSKKKSPSGCIAVSSISGRPPASSFCISVGSVSTISTILYDVRRCVKDSSVQYSVVGDSIYLTKGRIRSLRISCDDSSCKLWICTNGKETFDAEFAIWNAGKIASIYVDKYRFLE